MSAALAALRPVVAAEWIKLRSVRSTYAALLAAVGSGLLLGLLDTYSVAHGWSTLTPQQRAAFDPVGDSLSGFQLGELAFGVLGVLAMTTEYGTGAIATTFTAVPRRGLVFTAKALVVAAVTLVMGQLLVFATFLGCRPMLSGHGLAAGLGDPGVVRALVSAGLYLFAVAVVGLGLGALLRHTAGAIVTLFALVYLAYAAARSVEGWSYLPDRWVLSNAADVLASTAVSAHAPRLPSLPLAYLDLAAYLALAVVLGAWRWLRDA
jgi:ABC-2 type transport system permease protein